jgi:hypothetical protein
LPDLTYERMVSIINDGESVLLDGKIITRIQDLPLPEQLATTDADREANRKVLESQIAELQARLDGIQAQPAVSAEAVADGQDTDPTDKLPDAQINPQDGYPANHKALVALVRSKASPWPFSSPNPARAVLVQWLEEHKSE